MTKWNKGQLASIDSTTITRTIFIAIAVRNAWSYGREFKFLIKLELFSIIGVFINVKFSKFAEIQWFQVAPRLTGIYSLIYWALLDECQ